MMPKQKENSCKFLVYKYVFIEQITLENMVSYIDGKRNKKKHFLFMHQFYAFAQKCRIRPH